MNCTGVKRREQICREYDVKVVGCYKLFGGQTIVSDAGGNVISDKYYYFVCTHRRTNQKETIKCGLPTAKHICRLLGQELPKEFNPFQEENTGGGGGNGANGSVRWHRTRRQLHNAIMLFITRYGAGLKPGSPIFNIKISVEQNVSTEVEKCDVRGVNTILGRYNTTVSEILQQFARERAVRNFNFDTLVQIIRDSKEEKNNFE